VPNWTACQNIKEQVHCWVPPTCMRTRACLVWLMLLVALCPTVVAGGLGCSWSLSLLAAPSPASSPSRPSLHGCVSLRACSRAPNRVTGLALPPVAVQDRPRPCRASNNAMDQQPLLRS
jgi:hypothetical protein